MRRAETWASLATQRRFGSIGQVTPRLPAARPSKRAKRLRRRDLAQIVSAPLGLNRRAEQPRVLKPLEVRQIPQALDPELRQERRRRGLLPETISRGPSTDPAGHTKAVVAALLARSAIPMPALPSGQNPKTSRMKLPKVLQAYGERPDYKRRQRQRHQCLAIGRSCPKQRRIAAQPRQNASPSSATSYRRRPRPHLRRRPTCRPDWQAQAPTAPRPRTPSDTK